MFRAPSGRRRAGGHLREPTRAQDLDDVGLLDATRRLLGDDRGAVTVEAALALCSLVAVMAFAVAAMAGASAHLRCLDAAREAARLVARGEPDRARELAAAVAPRGAQVRIQLDGDQVQVDVSTAVVPGVPGLSLDARAVGLLEPAALLTSGGSPDNPDPDNPDPASGPVDGAIDDSGPAVPVETGSPP